MARSPRNKQASRKKQRPTDAPRAAATDLRVIGGRHRGRKLQYHGDPVTRPMKHRVREAIFNLVGTEVRGKHALDVFAGTGALGLEALSRGAVSATFIERHVPTARVVEQNIAELQLTEQSELLVTSAFLWAVRDLPNWSGPADDASRPWMAFISPPYAFFVDRLDDMLALVGALVERAPPESIVIVEADERFEFEQLPGGIKSDENIGGWDVRAYAPAIVAVWRKPAAI